MHIAYDRDEAGERAAEELAPKLMDRGIECFRIQFPKGMDANEYALKVQPAEKSLGALVRSAVWLGKGRAAKEEACETAEAAESSPEPPAEPFPLAAKENQAAEIAEAGTAPAASLATEADEARFRLGDRRGRVRGLGKNLSFDQLKVNVLVGKAEESGAFHVDTFDPYSAKQRAVYVKQAAEELGVPEEVVKKDLGKILLELEARQEAEIRRVMEPSKKEVEIGEEEKARAFDLLRDPDLLGRILWDFEKCGVVGSSWPGRIYQELSLADVAEEYQVIKSFPMQ